MVKMDSIIALTDIEVEKYSFFSLFVDKSKYELLFNFKINHKNKQQWCCDCSSSSIKFSPELEWIMEKDEAGTKKKVLKITNNDFVHVQANETGTEAVKSVKLNGTYNDQQLEVIIEELCMHFTSFFPHKIHVNFCQCQFERATVKIIRVYGRTAITMDSFF
jgi:hypothetical protein